MTNTHYLLSDASTGDNICELPFTGVSWTEVLTGVGTFNGTLPLWHPSATESNLIGDREITAVIDDKPVWNGPLTNADAALADGTVQVTAREPSWYFSKRTLEVDKHYNADLFSIVRKLVTYMTTKTDATIGDIVALIPRLSVATGTAGVTTDIALSGQARHTIQEILDYLVTEDLPSGLEYRFDYATGSTRQSCQRTMTLGAPFSDVSPYTLRDVVLNDYNRGLDWEDAATRAHARGAGDTETKQNSGAVTAGTLLLESVDDFSDVSKASLLKAMAREMRRRRQPPVRNFGAAWIPGPSLPYDAFSVGDTVPFDTSQPSMLSMSAASRRVTTITTTPEAEGNPLVRAMEFNLPLDQTGA